MTDVQFHHMPDGRRIAFRHTSGAGPALVFLPGYMSDMAGGKACAVFDWAVATNHSALLLDYSGCGASAGDFAEGTLTLWRDEVLALISAQCPGEILFIGSSMGGWLMLMCALALPAERRTGLVGLAPAPDFTNWGVSAEDKETLLSGNPVYKPNEYGPEPTPTYPGLWADGEANRMLDGHIPLNCPVRLIHGQADSDVPWEISLRLAAALQSSDVRITMIKDGDHRLSRDQDIALLIQTLETLVHPS